ncbi:MAG: large repetitive protein, partial [Frankiaceae bacterium]|nr:large repetitive protein [Frankiaceae bacterium]
SVASSSSITAGEAIAEYWRWGGQSLIYWPSRPLSDFFVGTLDEVALYPKVLTSTQVQAHYYSRAR